MASVPAKQIVCTGAGALLAVVGIIYAFFGNGDAVTIDPHMKEQSRQLCNAARTGDVVAVRRLLEAGASPNAVWDAAEAAKAHERMQEEMLASMPKHLADLGLSAEMIADLPVPSEFGQPPIAPYSHEIPHFCAAESGSVECVELLLKAGANLLDRDCQGRTALFYAGSPEAARFLIEAGIDMRAVSPYGDDALSNLLDGFPHDGLPDDEQARDRITRTCKALIDAGIPLMQPNAQWGNSRLYDAAFRENFHAVKFLLDAGHPIDADKETTALHAICWHWDYSDDERNENTRAIVRALLAAGISPHARNADGNTPLHEAMSGDGSNLIAAEELLAAGADINAVNDDGVTPLLLHYETLYDYERVVPFMLERGANPLIADRRGQTVIDAARRMIEGGQPMWRTEMAEAKGDELCGWKSPAEPDDAEHRMLALLEKAAARFASK